MFGCDKDFAPIYNLTRQVDNGGNHKSELTNVTWDEIEKHCRKLIKDGVPPRAVRITETVHDRIPQFIIDRMKKSA